MSEASAGPPAAASPWTCPFCPLACDHLGVRVGAGMDPLALQGGECGRASRALAQFAGLPSGAGPEVDGEPCDLDTAAAAAARLLGASRQPLFGGLGTDVAGARALYPLACATGAICDCGAGEALMHGLRALQDRGQFTTTLAEVRTRADLIVFVGGLPTDLAPLIGLRCGIGDTQVPQRQVVVLGAGPGDEAALAAWAGQGGVGVEVLPLQGDLFDTLALLSALVAQRALPAAPEPLHALAQRLRAARYAVLVGAPARLPAQGALIVEAVHHVVGSLNRTTRAAALWVGGGNGAATVNQVFAWLSGLPLRSRLGPSGLEHEPQVFDAARLLADGAVDALLWVSSFDAEAVPPPNRLPMVVLGHPALAAAGRRSGIPTVFIPVSTPGIGSAGHLFRTDGTVLMPLDLVVDDQLPTVADAVGRVVSALRAAREGNPA
ncbi:MAG TPA: formylmethanofuran dehydrogenase [Caldimonas sp.]